MFTLEEYALRLVYIIKIPPFNLMVDICLQTLMFMCRTVTYSLCNRNTIFEGHKKIYVKIKKQSSYLELVVIYLVYHSVLISLEYNDPSLCEHLKVMAFTEVLGNG